MNKTKYIILGIVICLYVQCNNKNEAAQFGKKCGYLSFSYSNFYQNNKGFSSKRKYRRQRKDFNRNYDRFNEYYNSPYDEKYNYNKSKKRKYNRNKRKDYKYTSSRYKRNRRNVNKEFYTNYDIYNRQIQSRNRKKKRRSRINRPGYNEQLYSANLINHDLEEEKEIWNNHTGSKWRKKKDEYYNFISSVRERRNLKRRRLKNFSNKRNNKNKKEKDTLFKNAENSIIEKIEKTEELKADNKKNQSYIDNFEHLNKEKEEIINIQNITLEDEIIEDKIDKIDKIIAKKNNLNKENEIEKNNNSNIIKKTTPKIIKELNTSGNNQDDDGFIEIDFYNNGDRDFNNIICNEENDEIVNINIIKMLESNEDDLTIIEIS